MRNMTWPRQNHAATALADGRVLVAGGTSTPTGATSTVEVFDPAARTWLTVAAMHGARLQHTATLLAEGRELVTGGTADSTTPLATAEL